MIDRPARDWLADLVERTLPGEFDPINDIRAFSNHPSRWSKDPIIQEGLDELEDYVRGKQPRTFLLDSGSLINMDDQRRRMQNLITYLKTDTEMKNDGPGCLAIIAVVLLLALVIACFCGPYESGGKAMSRLGEILFACIFVTTIPLYLLNQIGFLYTRWISPPKVQTDEQDPWPFSTHGQLLAAREIQAIH